MIAYCKADAQAAFTELADILEKTAATSIGGDQPISNAVLLDEIRRIVEADPIANPIRTAFEKAWDIAARAGDAETERELHTRHIDLITDFNAVDAADNQEGAGENYQRHLRSHAAWVRAISASIDDSDKQAADGNAIARKVADAVGDKLKPTLKYIADEAHGAKVAAEAAAKLIRGLRPEWLTGDKATPSEYIQIAGSIKMRIYELWKSYDHNPEDNGGRKADYATFYELNGGKEIRSGETLQSFIEDQAKKDRKNRTPEELIKRIIKSERERLRQSEKKQKTTSRQIRRK